MGDIPAWLSPSAALRRFGDPRQQLTEQTEQIQRYGFRIGELALLLQAGIPSEVVEQPAIFPLPNAPEACAGLVNLRGTLIPVYDLERARGMTSGRRTRKPNLLILGSGEHSAGLLIDGLPALVQLNPDQAMPPPNHLPPLLRKHAGLCFAHNGRMWTEFDYESFITALLTSDSDEFIAATNQE